MDTLTTNRVTAWLKANRGSTSQADLADDITAKTGWRITRDRYSKYESGSLPIGRVVYEHLLEYWAAKGQPGPDLTPLTKPATEPTLASVLMALATELRASREDREQMEFRLRAVEGELESLRARQAGGGSPEQSSLRGSTG